jgi:hypothetical protein
MKTASLRAFYELRDCTASPKGCGATTDRVSNGKIPAKIKAPPTANILKRVDQLA